MTKITNKKCCFLEFEIWLPEFIPHKTRDRFWNLLFGIWDFFMHPCSHAFKHLFGLWFLFFGLDSFCYPSSFHMILQRQRTDTDHHPVTGKQRKCLRRNNTGSRQQKYAVRKRQFPDQTGNQDFG